VGALPQDCPILFYLFFPDLTLSFFFDMIKMTIGARKKSCRLANRKELRMRELVNRRRAIPKILMKGRKAL
jgi:hypothetical protein